MNPEVFSKVTDALRTKVSDFNYKNWFSHLDWLYEEPNRVVVKVPTKFTRDWIQQHYLELIKFELFRHTEREFDLSFKIDRNLHKGPELFEQKDLFPQPGEPNPVGTVNNFIRQSHARSLQADRARMTALGFNPNYSFDQFVVGNSNQLVHAGCKAVALKPAKSYNPLFIYGGVGLGKTHLINAVGMEIFGTHPECRIVYVTGEHFTNEVIEAIRTGKTFELRKKYRDNCEMLLIDDIQFIAGKERTMEEFFHTFNTLYEARKQLVFTSDRLPKDMANLEERLRSRFGWGLMADIQPPDFETRVAILQRKAEREKTVVPADVCEYIAQNITANVRDLEGALIRVCAFASLSKTAVTMDLAREVLDGILTTAKQKLTVESVQGKICEFYNLRPLDLKSKRRHRNLAVPRQIAMYLCKKHVGASFPVIGYKFGGKDHTTVMHACTKITGCMDSDPLIRSEVTELEKRLGVQGALAVS